MPIILDRANPYADVAVLLGNLPNAEQGTREARGLTAKQAATEIGIGADTLANFEAGSNYTRNTLLAVVGWLAR